MISNTVPLSLSLSRSAILWIAGLAVGFACSPGGEIGATIDYIKPRMPNAPTNLGIEVLSNNDIRLTWEDTSDNERDFRVERKLVDETDWQQIAKLKSDTITFTDRGLSPGTLYEYRVRSTDRRFKSPYTDVVRAETKIDCMYTLDPSSASVLAAGTTGMFMVKTADGCRWTVENKLDWVTVSTSEGTGPGAVSYTVSANTTPGARNGVLAVAGQSFSINQGGSACDYSVSVKTISVDGAGGTGNVDVTAPAGCKWTASESLDWVTISGPSEGEGNGRVSYSVAANSATTPRSGGIMIADQEVTLNQAGVSAPCTFTLDATRMVFSAAGGIGQVAVKASASTCAWQAQSNVPWITIPVDSQKGVGDGMLTYSVAANKNSANRVGTMTIGEQAFAVEQKMCVSSRSYFVDEVWPKVLNNPNAVVSCQACHVSDGIAGATRLILSADDDANFSAARTVAQIFLNGFDDPLLVLKPTATVGHGGGQLVQPGSAEEAILKEFSAQANSPDSCTTP